MDNTDNFYLVLPSNSSMMYYKDNTTTCFTTHLSREIKLSGNWSVGLAEVHVPCTVVHISPEDSVIRYKNRVWLEDSDIEEYFMKPGIYENVEEVVDVINTALGDVKNHLIVELVPEKKGYYRVRQVCQCMIEPHYLKLSEKVRRILGFEMLNEEMVFMNFENPSMKSARVLKLNGEKVGELAASLYRAIPDQLYVYTDISEPYTVGDTQASLLRIVSLSGQNYKYGCNIVKNFAPIHYIPLLHHSFNSIIIDIRDQYGEKIPFEYGTLTVTLHFKRDL